LFEVTFSKLPTLFGLLDQSTANDFKDIIADIYPSERPKAFLMKARLFFISFLFYPLQSEYSFEFLRVFFYDNKKLPENCKLMLVNLHNILKSVCDEIRSSEIRVNSDPEISQIIKVISELDFDKCSWAFLFVYFTYKKFYIHDRMGKDLSTELMAQ
jgi:hypothetical protein